VCSGPRSPPSSSSSRRDSRLAARAARSSWTFSMRQLWRRVSWRLAMDFPGGVRNGGEFSTGFRWPRRRWAGTTGAMLDTLRSRYPALLALLSQILALTVVATCLVALARLGEWRPTLWQAALGQGLLAAALGHWLGLRRWWLPLNLAFVPGLLALHSRQDRKSTRLNSSHVKISYAVF